MKIWIAKVISLFLLLLFTLVSGLLPVKLVAHLRKRDQEPSPGQVNSAGRSSKARTILGYFNCFSGGVFLGISLLHLFPEVAKDYENFKDKTSLTFSFPIAQLIIAVGFFLIMMIEHGAMSYHNMKQQEREQAEDHERRPILAGHHHGSYHTDGEGDTAEREDGQEIADRVVQGTGACSSFLHSYERSYECNDEAPHHHHPGQTHEETEQIHGIRSLMLLLALSLHTVFEGMALGLQKSASDTWTLFGALAIHKSIISFTLGLQLTDTFHQTSRVVLYMVLYSLVCPIGVGVGTAVSTVDPTSLAMSATSMTLQGLATGTFLYVTFFEVLQKELGVEEHSITKVLAIIFGFTIMAVSTVFEG